MLNSQQMMLTVNNNRIKCWTTDCHVLTTFGERMTRRLWYYIRNSMFLTCNINYLIWLYSYFVDQCMVSSPPVQLHWQILTWNCVFACVVVYGGWGGGTYERQLAGRVVLQTRRQPSLCLYLKCLVPYNSAIRWPHGWSVACEPIISQGRLSTSFTRHTLILPLAVHFRDL